MVQSKKAQVILLPTDDETNVFITVDNKLFNYHKSQQGDGVNTMNQHLYIVSKDNIKKGDWRLDIFMDNSKPILADKNYRSEFTRKIIATTDSSLIIDSEESYKTISHGDVPYKKSLPQPTKEWIEYYISEYNKGNIITDVLVEYENYEMLSKVNYRGNYDFTCTNCKNEELDLWFSKEPTYCYKCCKLKVNPKDNTITIKELKGNYSREEVEKLLWKLANGLIDNTIKPNDKDTGKWIEQNL